MDFFSHDPLVRCVVRKGPFGCIATAMRDGAPLFRDPDGNLVNFFTPVSAEAIRKLDA